VISIVIRLPFSSVRGFITAVAAFLRGEDDEKRRLHFAADCAFNEVAITDPIHLDCGGRRKSRIGSRRRVATCVSCPQEVPSSFRHWD
jgi:hypothetical protein